MQPYRISSGPCRLLSGLGLLPLASALAQSPDTLRTVWLDSVSAVCTLPGTQSAMLPLSFRVQNAPAGRILIAQAGLAQVVPPEEPAPLPAFRELRYDEDYRRLAADFGHSDQYRRLKYSPFGKKGTAYLSLGGEVRAEYVRFWNEDWGEGNEGQTAFWLQRYQLHADWHLSPRLRLFGQLRSALENGRRTGPRPIDADRLNLQQLFVDYQLGKNSPAARLLIRLGRQEINYGSERLISVRDGPNLRLFFDGLKAVYTRQLWQIDALAMQSVTVLPGVFDNRRSTQFGLWGVYAVRQRLTKWTHADLYYLGLYRPEAVFEEGTASETRHTVGGRLWRLDGPFTHDWEGAVQWGRLGDKPILAWTFSSDIGYIFTGDWRVRSVLGLRTDLISGDAQAGDGRLQTFNPLYPKGGYFGFDPQIGPANLIDVHPYLTLGTKFSMGAEVVFNWRFSLGDGIYRPSGNFRQAGNTSPNRYIATAYLLKAAYQLNRFGGLSGGMQWFVPGPFLRDAGAQERGLFGNIRLQLYW